MKMILYILAFILATTVSNAQKQQPVNTNPVTVPSADGEFKNIRTFTQRGNILVPKGVTRMKIEVWGAGGGGTVMGGGGGGAYGWTIVDVAEGNALIIEPGTGGTGHLTRANKGQNSIVSYKIGAGNPTVLFSVEGGDGSENAMGSVTVGGGGNVVETRSPATGYYYLPGEDGTPYQDYSRQSGSSAIVTRFYGKGGDAGNAPNSGGRGAIVDNGAPTQINIRFGSNGKMPGGGGGAGYATKGYNGGNGMVIIYY